MTPAGPPAEWYDDEDEWADSPCSWPIEDDEGEDDEAVCLPEPMPAKPRVGRAMRRVLAYLAQQPAPVTCTAVYRGAGLDSSHLSGRMPLWRCEAAGLVRVDRLRSNLYGVTITDRGREHIGTGRASISPSWDDAYRWEPGDGILERIDMVLAQQGGRPSGVVKLQVDRELILPRGYLFPQVRRGLRAPLRALDRRDP